MSCQCAAAGWCKTYKRTMSPRQQQICAGELLTPEKCEGMRQIWAEQAGLSCQTKPRTDCQHRGDELRRELCTTCTGTTLVKVFGCQVKGECTIGKPLPGVACCRSCTSYQRPPVERPEFVTTAKLIADVYDLAARLPRNLAGVIGVARSGVLPATLLAMHLHVPLWILRQFEKDIVPAGHGYRLRGHQPDGPLLVVDDTTASGASMRLARQTVAAAGLADVLYAAIYPADPAGLDYFGRVLPLDHLLEWNFFNSIHVQRSAFDFDGILCDDGDGKPKHLPRRLKLPLLVTGRPETERAASQAWLAEHGVTVERAVFWPGTLADRAKPMAVSRYKAKHYRESKLDWFVESCPIQAHEIAELTGKPVICPAAAKVF